MGPDNSGNRRASDVPFSVKLDRISKPAKIGRYEEGTKLTESELEFVKKGYCQKTNEENEDDPNNDTGQITGQDLQEFFLGEVSTKDQHKPSRYATVSNKTNKNGFPCEFG